MCALGGVRNNKTKSGVGMMMENTLITLTNELILLPNAAVLFSPRVLVVIAVPDQLVKVRRRQQPPTKLRHCP